MREQVLQITVSYKRKLMEETIGIINKTSRKCLPIQGIGGEMEVEICVLFAYTILQLFAQSYSVLGILE